MNWLKAALRRMVPLGIFLAAIAGMAQFLAGCAVGQFPLMQTTFFNVRQSTPGEFNWVANATGSADAYVLSSSVKAQLEITGVQGQPPWVEGLLFNSPDGPIVVPIKQQTTGSGFTFGVADPLDFRTASKAKQEQIDRSPEGAAPPSIQLGTEAVVLWKNALNENNYRPGVFNAGCFCYENGQGELNFPTLRMSGSEVVPSFEKVSIWFNATYTVGAGS